DHDRRRPEVWGRVQVWIAGRELRIERRPAPHDPQLADVLAVDLIEWRVSRETLVAAVGAPLADWLVLGADGRNGESDEDSAEASEDEASPLHRVLLLFHHLVL